MVALVNDHHIECVSILPEVNLAHGLHRSKSHARSDVDLAACDRTECLTIDFKTRFCPVH